MVCGSQVAPYLLPARDTPGVVAVRVSILVGLGHSEPTGVQMQPVAVGAAPTDAVEVVEGPAVIARA